MLQILHSHFPSHFPSKLHTISTFRTLYTLTLYTLTLYTLMYLRIYNCVNTEKDSFFKIRLWKICFVTGVLCSQTNPLVASRYRNCKHTIRYTQADLSGFLYIFVREKVVHFLKLGLFTPGGSSKLITCSDTY